VEELREPNPSGAVRIIGGDRIRTAGGVVTGTAVRTARWPRWPSSVAVCVPFSGWARPLRSCFRPIGQVSGKRHSQADSFHIRRRRTRLPRDAKGRARPSHPIDDSWAHCPGRVPSGV